MNDTKQTSGGKNCAECGKPVDLKIGDTITVLGKATPIGDDPNLCRACFESGWSKATVEDFANDPSFTIGIQSPIQRHDL